MSASDRASDSIDISVRDSTGIIEMCGIMEMSGVFRRSFEVCLRVAYLAHTARQPLHGVGHSTLALAEALACRRDGDEFIVFRSTGPAWEGRAFDDGHPGLRFIELPAIAAHNRAARIFWEQLVLPSQLRAHQVDLVHSPSYILPLRANAPGIVTVHDILALTRPELCKPETRVHYGLLLPRTVRHASRIIVPSRSVQRQLREKFGIEEDRIRVVLPGIRDSFRKRVSDDEIERVRLRYRLPETFILAPGNREPKKNLARLIAAFHKARGANLAGELLLIGGRGWGGDFGESDGPSVRWLGYVPEGDVTVLFGLASEVAFPSLAEGFGLPVIEALASGTIVVASEVPAVQEVGPDAVVLVDPLSVSKIAMGLLKARENPGLRHTLKERGIKAGSHFSWERAARDTWEIYREEAAAL